MDQILNQTLNQTLPSITQRDGLDSLVSACKGFLNGLTYAQLLLGIIFATTVFSFLDNRPSLNVPYVGYRSWFEPTFWVRSRFFSNATSIIADGYKKYKGSMFVVRRNDTDIVIMSNKYLEELRLLPDSKMSGKHANIKNLQGYYTYSTEILDGNLHVRAIQNQLTPNLSVYLERASEEMELGFQMDVPEAEEWTEIDIQDIIRKLVSRMSTAVFLGYPVCRNKDWLGLCVEYSINVFTTSLTLRMFPPFMHPVIARLLPSRRKIKQNLVLAEKILTPLIESFNQRSATSGGEEDRLSTMLDWMLENATAEEKRPGRLANRQLLLTLASIHSTSSTVSQALFDLCAHPELIEPLEQEIKTVLETAGVKRFNRDLLQRLEISDSFLAESQRLNPLILLNPQRLIMQPLTLKDGTHLPKGTHIAFPAVHILLDDEINPNAEKFDAFRYYRDKNANGVARHTYGQNDKNHLAFGNGRTTCPGRLFAVAEIKTVLARFLLEYDFKFPEGKTRPDNLMINEMIICNPEAKLMIRKKAKPLVS